MGLEMGSGSSPLKILGDMAWPHRPHSNESTRWQSVYYLPANFSFRNVTQEGLSNEDM